MSDLLTTREAARKFGSTPAEVKKLAVQHRVARVKLGRHWIVYGPHVKRCLGRTMPHKCAIQKRPAARSAAGRPNGRQIK